MSKKQQVEQDIPERPSLPPIPPMRTFVITKLDGTQDTAYGHQAVVLPDGVGTTLVIQEYQHALDGSDMLLMARFITRNWNECKEIVLRVPNMAN